LASHDAGVTADNDRVSTHKFFGHLDFIDFIMTANTGRECRVARMHSNRSGSRGLLVIAAFKLLKGLLLLAVGIGALKLLHKDVAAEVAQWVNLIRVDPDSVILHRVLAKLSILDDRKLKHLFTEGVGLAFRKRWAEYFTIIITTSLIPLELWELAKHVGPAKIGVLVVNVAIVVYLILEVRRNRRTAEEILEAPTLASTHRRG
jgi:uncharacterized membrane protein (DUF2068 family)